MPCIRIEEGAFSTLSNHSGKANQSLDDALRNVASLQNNAASLRGNLQDSLAYLQSSCLDMQYKMQQIHQFLQESVVRYTDLEHSLRNQSDGLEKLPSKWALAIGLGSLNLLHKAGNTNFRTFVGDTQTSFHHPFQNDGFRNIFRSGLRGDASFQLDMAGMSYSHQIKNLQFQTGASLGHAKIEGKAHLALKQGDVFDPSLNLEVGAKAALAHGTLSLAWKNAAMGLSGSASGELGSVEAKGIAKISKKGIHIEGEVGAAAAKGKVVGSFELFGIKVTATAHGEAGALGVGGTFKVEDKSFEIGAKASCIIGGGVDFKVDW